MPDIPILNQAKAEYGKPYNPEVCPVENATTANGGSRTEKSTIVGRPLKRL